MKRRCKTCYYYKPKSYTCMNPTGILYSDDISLSETGNRMIYYDSDGYAAEFRTEPNFGCIHHLSRKMVEVHHRKWERDYEREKKRQREEKV